MKLFLVHCGFYDSELCDGIYESHINLFVAAETFEDARSKVKLASEFKAKRMHVDGIQEITAVDGYSVILNENPTLNGKTVIMSSRHRDLPSKPKETVSLQSASTQSREQSS